MTKPYPPIHLFYEADRALSNPSLHRSNVRASLRTYNVPPHPTRSNYARPPRRGSIPRRFPRSILPLSLGILGFLNSWFLERENGIVSFFPRHRWWDRPEGEWHDPAGMWNAFGNWRELTRVKDRREKEGFSKCCVTTCRIRRGDGFILPFEEGSEDLIKHLLLPLSLIAVRIAMMFAKKRKRNRRQLEIRNLWIYYFRFEMITKWYSGLLFLLFISPF